MYKIVHIVPGILLIILLMGSAVPTASAQTADSDPFDITPSAAVSLTWVAAPSEPITAGTNWTTVTVRITDQYGNTRTPDNTTVITVTRVSGSGSFASGFTATVSAGIATFSALKYNTAETITVNAIAAGLANTTTTGNLVVNPAAGNNLTFVANPASITAGNTWASVTVRVADQFNNDVPGVEVAITTTIGTYMYGVLTATSNASGIATFTPISMTVASTTQYALSASAAACTTITSNGFTISSAAVSAIAFVAGNQPTTTEAGVSMSPVVYVRALDVYSNLVPNIVIDVIVSPTVGTLLYGTTQQNTTTVRQTTIADPGATYGIAIFADLSIRLTGTGFRLQATVVP